MSNLPLEMSPAWQAALARITGGEIRRVLVLGAPDAGKSTFCSMLLAHAAKQSRQAAFLDADPGQKHLGPPGCVTLGCTDGHGVPVLLKLVYLGAVEPLGRWGRLIAGCAFLAAEARADLLVVNTCGLLRGPGRRLKGAMISALQPDLLVAIGEGRELEAVLRDHPMSPAIVLPRSPLARRKGEGERRALRRTAFRLYFEHAPAWALPVAGIRLQSETGEPHPSPGRLVALADEAGTDLTLGLVLRLDLPGSLLLRAPLPDRPVAGLRWGSLGLDEAWAERHVASTHQN
jgi:polynucleotide 5'-hydroxyl-kinase GRC3/NOL9